MNLRELIEEAEKKVLKITKVENVPDDKGLIINFKHNSNKVNGTAFFVFNPITYKSISKREAQIKDRDLTLKEKAEIYTLVNRFEINGVRNYKVKKLAKVMNEKRGLFSIKEIVFPETEKKIVVYGKERDGIADFYAKAERA